MICCAEPNQKGEHPCKIYPVTLCFACRRYSRSFPSVAAHGGRAARAVGIRNPSNSARAQQRGERRILPRFWKSSPSKRRKNETRFFPGSSSVTLARVPEAGIPSRLYVPDAYLAPSPYPPATRRIQLRSTADTHLPHSRWSHHVSSFSHGCLFIRPALSPRASLRFVYTLRVWTHGWQGALPL